MGIACTSSELSTGVLRMDAHGRESGLKRRSVLVSGRWDHEEMETCHAKVAQRKITPSVKLSRGSR